MKRSALSLLLLLTVLCSAASASHMSKGYEDSSPSVIYMLPRSQSEVNISGKDSVLFKWKSQPTPPGGRLHFAFSVFKGFSNNKIFDGIIPPGETEVEVPASLFEEGLYSWQVRQRSVRYKNYSRKQRWSFTVTKDDSSE